MASSKRDEQKIANTIQKIITALNRKSITKADDLVRDAFDTFGDEEPIILRAHAEVQIAWMNVQETEKQKDLYYNNAVSALVEATRLAPQAVEYWLRLAKLRRSKEEYRWAIDECERALLIKEPLDPYKKIPRYWNGKVLGRMAQNARTSQVLASILNLMYVCKRWWVYHQDRFSLTPRFNPLQPSTSRVPHLLSQYWNAYHYLQKQKFFRSLDMFKFLDYVDGTSPHGGLLLDLMFRFSISGSWIIWACGVCKRKFSNPVDFDNHVMTHTVKMSSFCPEYLPGWVNDPVDAIWMGENFDTRGSTSGPLWLDSLSGTDSYCAEGFNLKIQAEDLLFWLYKSANVFRTVKDWEEIIASTKSFTESNLEKLGPLVESLNAYFQLIKEIRTEVSEATREGMDEATREKSEQLEKYLVFYIDQKVTNTLMDIKDLLQEISNSSRIDSQPVVEALAREFIKLQLEEELNFSEGWTPAKIRLVGDLKGINFESDIDGGPQSHDDIMLWDGFIDGPYDTPWDGGTFKLILQFTKEYPNKPPSVHFVSRMFHPNIYADGSICQHILQNKWSPTYDVADILHSIQSLLKNPNPNSPANHEAARMFSENKHEYDRLVREIVEENLTMNVEAKYTTTNLRNRRANANRLLDDSVADDL